MASLHNSKTYQKGKIDMTKAHKIKNLQSVVDKFSKLYNYHIFIDFNSMNNDTLYLLAEEDLYFDELDVDYLNAISV